MKAFAKLFIILENIGGSSSSIPELHMRYKHLALRRNNKPHISHKLKKV